MCTSTFPGISSAQNMVCADIPACVNHRMAAKGGTNAYPGGAAERGENMSPCTVPKSRYASGSTMDWSTQVKECTVEPATVAEGDMCAGDSIPVNGGGRVGATVWAHSFVAAETTLGLACLSDLLPTAYRSLYLQLCLPLTVLICSMLVFPPVRPDFYFRAFLTPMHLTVSVQVFLFGWKTSFLGNIWALFAKAIAALRLYLTDLSALRSRVKRLPRVFSC